MIPKGKRIEAVETDKGTHGADAVVAALGSHTPLLFVAVG